jgi:F0F1-type ATP synthase membrane subunit b/b'
MADVTREEKIAAGKKALDEAKKVYEDAQAQYAKAEALYNKAKAAAMSTPLPNVLNTLTPEDRDKEIKKYKDEAKKLEKKAQQELEKAKKAYDGAKKRIAIIQEQFNTLATQKTLKEKSDQQKVLSNKKVKNGSKRINQNKTKLKAGLKKVISTGGPIAIVFVFGRVLNSYITRLSDTVSQLTTLVDKTNDTIQAATTKADIQKASVSRNAALATLDAAEAQVRSFGQVIQSMSSVINIFTTIINIASALPTAPYQIATIGIIASRIIAKFNPVVLSLSVLLQISQATLESFLASIAYERSRLLPLNNALEQAIQQNLTPEETRDLIVTINSGLGPVVDEGGNSVEYSGFTFSILEENDPNFVVAGNKRRYAVALDRSGFTVVQSTPSFTLDPNVLIEELKLEIDKRNLEA